MNHLKIKKSVVFIMVMTIFVIFSSMMVGYSRPSGEELIIRNFMSSGTAHNRLILNGWAVVDDTKYKIYTEGDFEKFIKPLFSSFHYSITIYSVINSTTITAKGLINPKVSATITLIKHNIISGKPSQASYIVLSLESKDPDNSYSFLNTTMNSFLGRDYHKSMVISGSINRSLSPRERDIFVRNMFRGIGVQNMETLAAGPLVSVTGYTPSVRNVLTAAGKSVNINIALRYSAVDNKTMVYVGSPVITSEY